MNNFYKILFIIYLVIKISEQQQAQFFDTTNPDTATISDSLFKNFTNNIIFL